jgi:hypothetical protein
MALRFLENVCIPDYNREHLYNGKKKTANIYNKFTDSTNINGTNPVSNFYTSIKNSLRKLLIPITM